MMISSAFLHVGRRLRKSGGKNILIGAVLKV